VLCRDIVVTGKDLLAFLAQVLVQPVFLFGKLLGGLSTSDQGASVTIVRLTTKEAAVSPGQARNACRVRVNVTSSGMRDTFSSMWIGYGRVSTRDQHPEAQHDALTAAGCDEIFIDKASGKLARRPELDKALLSANRADDQLVITKLDRLGRSLDHLIELSELLQTRNVDLVVLDQGIDTSTAVGRLFLDHRSDRRVRTRPHVRAHDRRPSRRQSTRPNRGPKAETGTASSKARPADVRGNRRRRQTQIHRPADRQRVRRHPPHHLPTPVQHDPILTSTAGQRAAGWLLWGWP
jgi:Resolvase, N terminal domain